MYYPLLASQGLAWWFCGGGDGGSGGDGGAGETPAPGVDVGGDASDSSLGALEIGLIIAIVCFVIVTVVVVVMVSRKKE